MSLDDAEPDSEADGPRRYRAPALEKGLDILELLARQGSAMTTSQISAALDRSVSELFRMVQVLEYRGYIEPAADGDGYELSSKLFALAMTRAPVRTLMEAALPVMRQLSAEARQSCHLAIASDDQMVVVARVENPGYVGFSVRPGYRRPLTDSTSGAVLMAFQPEAARQALFARLAPGGRMSAAAFARRAEAIRAQGCEQAPSAFVEGVIDISAPVMGPHGAVAALTIPYMQSRPVAMTIEAAIAALQAAAGRISAELQGT
ncbi:IclR family transcriptional regulator [Phenylobacterium montanum]|uniref:IclR family transcriptional regulator n=1 Tax=Phenylobacterium montanum TaxID=2823693 RepID=A0A975IVU2_9CAUL|nr:IclR family transcriptional regulator [Caulobacter sp. S6]QUD87691.1 IclR family transcriptional regulator [Caulobacter sp. S6]